MDAKKENTAFEDEKSERAVSCVEISNKVFEEDEKLKKEREKESVRNAIKNVILGTLWMFIAYLLGKAELPFGAMPLGVALLCSASSKVRIPAQMALFASWSIRMSCPVRCTGAATPSISSSK